MNDINLRREDIGDGVVVKDVLRLLLVTLAHFPDRSCAGERVSRVRLLGRETRRPSRRKARLNVFGQAAMSCDSTVLRNTLNSFQSIDLQTLLEAFGQNKVNRKTELQDRAIEYLRTRSAN
ncbi:Uncharacterized protein FWK35_00030694 [Aphis craccivora]|uniref:SAP domain-containing protein n=1 Tax=Aphis craccivora TaxID=307492 RepID=A0A6G0YLS6_APHCR|nr:Uncharacterized protein FWK35_00030694 [Aphis craccivora]